MNAREFAMLCVLAAIVLSAISWLGTRHKRAMEVRSRRFELLAEALRDPNLDAGTRAEMLRALARGEHGVLGWLWQRLQNPMLWRVLWFGTGWMTMLLSGAALGMYAAGVMLIRSRDVPVTMMFTAFGFGMVTLPLAFRELLRREHAPGQGR